MAATSKNLVGPSVADRRQRRSVVEPMAADTDNGEEEEGEETDSFCWDSRDGSMSPSPKHSASSSHSSSPSRHNSSAGTSSSANNRAWAKRSMPARLRQGMFNGTSPLHVAALFASAAKAAVIGTGTDSTLARDENVSRLFMNSDEVFKLWEENMRLVEHERPQNGRTVRKNASMHERRGGGGGTNAVLHNDYGGSGQMLQRAQSTDIVALATQSTTAGGASVSKCDSLKLSTGSMPAGRLDVVAVQRQQRSASMQKPSQPPHQPALHKASQQSLLDAVPKRRASTMSDRRYGVAGACNGGSLELKKVALDNDYNMLKEFSSGNFGTVQLAEHKQSRQRVSLKMFERPGTKMADFAHEYQLARFFSAHPNILNTFDGCYETDDESALFFVQECAVGQISLRELLTNHPGGLTEQATKLIVLKVLAAVEFMHAEGLAHRNIRAESVLILDPNKLTRVKLTDLWLAKPSGSLVRHQETVNSYSGPELCDKVPNESYTVATNVDIWAIGILMAYCMKGKFPWQKATIMCKPYWEWDQWMKRKVAQLPRYWDMFTEKALKLFKHALNPKAKERWEMRELRKFVDKERLLKTTKEPHTDETVYYPDDDEALFTTDNVEQHQQQQKAQPKKSMIGQWLNHTLNAMSEISEQVVSARDND